MNDHDEWQLRSGDEGVLNDTEMKTASTAKNPSLIPSKLKAVIKFGYDEGLKIALGDEDFDAWIAGIFLHMQKYFRPPISTSLGTNIEFEVYYV